MIIRKIEVRDVRDKGKAELSLAAFFFSLPWCCITPPLLAVLGFFGAAGTARLLFKEALFPLFILSVLFLGRAHYLIYFKKRGSEMSRAIVWLSTIGAFTLWALRFGLISI